MEKFFALKVCLLLTFSVVFSQSNPDDLPVKKDYSESSIYQPTDFSEKKAKNKKKSDENKNAENSITESTPVLIPISVFSKDGKFVENLKKSDFKVFVNEKEQDFSLGENKNEQINIVLLIDSSPSTQFKIEEIQNFARQIINNLNPKDKVLVAEFNADFKILCELTNERQKLEKAIGKLKFGGGTSLYESISTLFQKTIGTIEGRRAVVLLTDGVDTTSLKSSYEKSLIEAEKLDAPVYPIYFDTLEINANNFKKLKSPIPGLNISGAYGLTEREYQVGLSYLNDLINLSGGRGFNMKDISANQKNVADFISKEMRLKYYLQIQPVAPIQTGKRNSIKIRINRPDLLILSRTSFIVGKGKKGK